MKRTVVFLIALICALPAFADDPKPPAAVYNQIRELKNRIFEVHNRDPRTIAEALHLLGSGFQGTGLSVNADLHTITVRDFPENIAAIEEALKRLDQPASADPSIEFHLYVVIGSNGPAGPREVPAELTDVVKQLQSTLRYANYGLMTTAVHHTRAGRGIEGSGVAETELLGMKSSDGTPVLYSYSLRQIGTRNAGVRESVDVEDFRFDMKFPIFVGGKQQYQSVGFQTPVTIHEGEKVVVGTTTMGDKALIVVMTTSVSRAAK